MFNNQNLKIANKLQKLTYWLEIRLQSYNQLAFNSIHTLLKCCVALVHHFRPPPPQECRQNQLGIAYLWFTHTGDNYLPFLLLWAENFSVRGCTTPHIVVFGSVKKNWNLHLEAQGFSKFRALPPGEI